MNRNPADIGGEEAGAIDTVDRLAYFERTTEAMRNLLFEKGMLTKAELERKMAEVRKRYDP